MKKLILNRRGFIKSSIRLPLLFVFASGCTPQIVTISNIIVAVRAVKQLLRVSRQLSHSNVYALNVSYKELGTFLNEKKFTTNVVQHMEQRSSYLTQGNNDLRSRINQTNSAANELFSLLYIRANQNSTPDLKNKMNSDIREKQNIFKEKMKIAEQVLSSIEKSSKKYDDILGYIQVAAGLAQIDQYIRDVDDVIVQAKALDRDIQTALRENEAIVSSFG
jgi:hypothetical protein